MGKCMNKSPGGCLVKHGQNYVTGIKLAGAICDHCEAFICHGRQVKPVSAHFIFETYFLSVYHNMGVTAL